MSMVTSKNIRLNLTVAVMVFWLAPLFAQANWYWLTIPEDPELGDVIELSPTEYAITSINKLQLYRLEDELVALLEQTRDSEACVGEYKQVLEELWEYDTLNKPTSNEITYLQDIKGNRISGPEVDIITNEEFVAGRDQLLRNTDVQLQRCLDDAEEKATKEARTKEITKAVQSCDLNFLDSMTTPEKMDTFREREACKVEVATSEVTEDTVETPVAKPTPVLPTPLQPSVSPATTLPPVITAPATVSAPELATEAETISDTEASNGPETIEPKTEPPVALELEELVDTAEPATAPSFFQRVVNFFTSWF